MKPFRFAVCVGLVALAAALFSGGDWRRVALGALAGALVGAMLETMPLVDWLYPKDTDDKPNE